MSNADTPAENTGGNPATPATASENGPLADLPARIRVHALAKLLGSSSREVLKQLVELGVSARSAQSSVPKEVAVQVAEALGVTADEVAPEQVAAVTEAPEAPTAPVTAVEAAPAPEPEPEPDPEPEPARPAVHVPLFAAPSPVFLPPEPAAAPAKRAPEPEPEQDEAEEDTAGDQGPHGDDDDEAAGRRRRRRGRRGRGRGKGGDDARDDSDFDEPEAKPEPKDTGNGKKAKAEEAPADKAEKADKADRPEEADEAADDAEGEESSRSRRRRRRRRKASGEEDGENAASADDPPNTVVHVRQSKADKGGGDSGGEKPARDEVRSVRGSTRLEAKRQRRRDGREAGRRRAPILSEAEFLARREAVERTMVVAEKGEETQIGVLEDGVLVEHFVTSSGSGSIVGNVYLGRVQNVLPSMEAAFIDIGRGRNAVLYAGEVDWDAAGLEGKARKIEQALSTGDSVLVQVTKDPVGHKGARLTTQISLPGRFLVYVPAGGATGISRKLPENERRRLKDILKRIVPEDAGVIIRTASEGIVEEELDRDVRRLKVQWDVIKEKADASKGKKSGAPTLLYEEPDLLVKVVRDLFTEDFAKLEVQGSTAWETIQGYVGHVAPDLAGRLKRYTGNGDVFAEYRIDEQITKALDRKVWLPSGGYLVIDRTEAMTVIDVNTGKFTGSGGNLEETVTRNNLESAEEIVRQLRLRDIGGIIVIDFIDMVLESNRELVLRRLTECLGRDRTRHQVAEVTSLGLVQMTRKKVGTGLLEAFSTTCEHCKGRGVVVSTDQQKNGSGGNNGGGGHQHGSSRRSRGRNKADEQPVEAPKAEVPAPQRESVVTAVQAVANASKPKAGESDGGEGEGGDVTEVTEAAPALNGHAPEQPAEEGALAEKADEPIKAGTAGQPGTRKRERISRAERRAQAAAAQEAELSEPGGEAQAEKADEPVKAGTAGQPEAARELAPAEQPKAEQPEAQEQAAEQPAEAVKDEEAQEVPAESPATVRAEAEAPQAPQAEQAVEEVPEVSVPAPAAKTTRRRARRVASRPAGPPVTANENS
ncbi:translation initiation factor IF-2 N-terminal domain-containing protein [Amycolatopsis magusensis]|uniref:Ribonuclease E n=1 Tax=Amycolatopsis magusensis TaxID=882444 RepID=A0ABS4PPY3_9PSEU|nr:translation initiation factor IF-2 N-terminal domain-containing protein [Amycolatopsis magusensis]MBP2181480.1 ribonuclease E [Amycolatopsis magusensis]